MFGLCFGCILAVFWLCALCELLLALFWLLLCSCFCCVLAFVFLFLLCFGFCVPAFAVFWRLCELLLGCCLAVICVSSVGSCVETEREANCVTVCTFGRLTERDFSTGPFWGAMLHIVLPCEQTAAQYPWRANLCNHCQLHVPPYRVYFIPVTFPGRH